MRKTVLILGGYGNTGRLIARYLLQESDANIVLAGRNPEKAITLASSLNQEFSTDRVHGMRLDAADREDLTRAFRKVDLVVVAASISQFIRNVAAAALEAEIDYLDTLMPSPVKSAVLDALKPQIEQAGLCYITEGGFHPGVPAALIRYANTLFRTLTRAEIGTLIRADWKSYSFSESTIREFALEFQNFQPIIFRNGEWKKVKWSEYKTFDFGKPFGEKKCTPMFLPELEPLPTQIPSLTQTGFYMAGWHWFTDYFIVPIVFLSLRLAPGLLEKPMGKLLEWGLKKTGNPPFETIVLLEAEGYKNNNQARMRLKLSHPDAYVLTAAPVVACLLQYLTGNLRRPGLWQQANIVEPSRFLIDLEKPGIKIEIEWEDS